jgi:Planctomycete cytochrome C/WD domain, G-beta repeat
MKWFAVTCAIGLLVPLARAADKPKAAKITYQEHVLPLLRDKCLGCHNSDKISGGLDASTYQKLMEGGGSGPVVKPGQPDASRMLLTISHKVQPFMPPKSDMLPQATLDLVRTWIEQGALEHSGSKVVALKPKADVSLTSVVRGRPQGPPPMPDITKLSPDPVIVTARANAVTAIAANPWSPLVAVAGQKQVILYHADTLQMLGVLPFPHGQVNVLKFSRNGSLLLAGGGRGGHSGKAVVWSVANGEKIIEVGDETETVLAADISADQTQIALGGPNKMIRIYSTKDGEKIRDIKKHTDWIYSMEYSPDGVLLATADRNGGLFVWEAYTGREYFSLRGHTAAVTDVSWRDDSNLLASCSEDTTIRLWEMENGGQVRSWGAHGGGVAAVRFSHDGRLASVGRDRVAKLWDQNGAQQKAFEPFPDLALRTAFTHDNSRVFAGDWTGLIRVFTTADGKTVGTVSNNPPPAAEQFEAALKDLVAKQTAHDQAKAAADAAASGLQQANANLAAAQKAATDATNAMNAAVAAMNQAKAVASAAQSAVPVAKAKVAAKDVALKAYQEAAAKVKQATDAAKNDPALVAELSAAQKLVTQTTADFDAAKKAFADATAAVTATAAKQVETEKAVPLMTANLANANKAVEVRTAEVKAASEKANAAQTALNAASANLLSAAKIVVDKYKALPPKK